MSSILFLLLLSAVLSLYVAALDPCPNPLYPLTSILVPAYSRVNVSTSACLPAQRPSLDNLTVSITATLPVNYTHLVIDNVQSAVYETGDFGVVGPPPFNYTSTTCVGVSPQFQKGGSFGSQWILQLWCTSNTTCNLGWAVHWQCLNQTQASPVSSSSSAGAVPQDNSATSRHGAWGAWGTTSAGMLVAAVLAMLWS